MVKRRGRWFLLRLSSSFFRNSIRNSALERDRWQEVSLRYMLIESSTSAVIDI